MKKGLIFATTLAMALGVGVAVGAHQNKAMKAEAWSGSECGDSWYVIGTINGQNWNSWNPFVLNGDRYEYVIDDDKQVEFKLTNTNSWSGIQINAGYGSDLDWNGKGWTSLTTKNGENFKTKVAGKYTLYYDKNITNYENGVWAFGIEEYKEPEPEPTDVPEEDGYYIVSTDTEFKYAGAAKMSAPEEGDDKAQLLGYTLGAGKAFKVRSYLSKTDTWYNSWGGEYTFDDDGNYINNGEEAVELDIYLNKDSVVYVSAHEEPEPEPTDVPEEDGYYIVSTDTEFKYAGAAKMSAPEEGDDKAQLLGYTLGAGKAFKVRSYLSKTDTWYNSWGGEYTFDDDGNYINNGEEAVELDIYLNKDSVVYVSAHEEPEPADVPETDGYYLISSLTNYKYAGATPMPQVDPSTGNVAVLLDYDPKPGEKIKARSYFSGEDKYSANVDGEKEYGKTDSDLNFEFADTIGEDDTFDIYAYYDGDTFLFSVAPHAERVTVSIVAKEYAGSHYQGETSVLYKDEEVIKGNTFIVPDVTPEGYVALGVYSDFNCTVPFISGETKVESTMLLHVKVMQLGWYLAGGEDETFSVENSMKLGTSAGNKCTGAVEVPEGTDDDNPFIVKPLEYVADAGSGKPGWASATYEMGHEGDPLFVHIDEETSNFIFTVPGTYAFYVNNENKVWFNGGEYAYIEDFLSHTGTVCHTQGTQTDLDLLQLLWAQFEEGFKGLSEDEAKDIKDVGFNGGDEKSDDAKLRMVARYAYIVTKYGTAMFKDFIWNQSVEAKPSSSVAFSSSEVNNSTMIIVISIAAVSALAFTTLLVFKKRKQK